MKKRGKNLSRIKIEHSKKILYVIIALFIALLALVIFSRTSQKKEKQEVECVADSDCVKQQTTCCSCNMGGEEICTDKNNASYYQEKLKDCPENLYCIALYNCKIKSCICEKGKCRGI